MIVDALLDPLFLTPFLTGLLIAGVLSILGTLLRLRGEWLAALGFAHLASMSALLGLVIHLPIIVTAPLGAAAGAMLKALGKFRGNSIYGVMILFGWAGSLLIAANIPVGSSIGLSIVEGQLYFTGSEHLLSAILIALAPAFALPWLIPRLVRARFFPVTEKANQLPAWRWHLGFDLLIAIGMATAISTVGLMAAFALAFLPAWTSFQIAHSWKHCLILSLIFGVSGYALAYLIAYVLDQPFGPVLVMTLLGESTVMVALFPKAVTRPH